MFNVLHNKNEEKNKMEYKQKKNPNLIIFQRKSRTTLRGKNSPSHVWTQHFDYTLSGQKKKTINRY